MATYPILKPNIPNPYPYRFEKVTDFQYKTRLVLAREPTVLTNRKVGEVSYIVDQDYTVSYKVDGKETILTVPRGMLTDLASVPRAARGFVGRVGPHLEAAIVHDFLFVAWQLLPDYRARFVDFEFANAVMFAGLEEADVPWLQRNAIRLALQFPGVAWSVYQERDDDDGAFGIFVDLDHPLAPESNVA